AVARAGSGRIYSRVAVARGGGNAPDTRHIAVAHELRAHPLCAAQFLRRRSCQPERAEDGRRCLSRLRAALARAERGSGQHRHGGARSRYRMTENAGRNMETVVIIAPLGEPGKRVRLAKTIRLISDDHGCDVAFWGWRRTPKESLGAGMEGISESRALITGGGF